MKRVAVEVEVEVEVARQVRAMIAVLDGVVVDKRGADSAYTLRAVGVFNERELQARTQPLRLLADEDEDEEEDQISCASC